MSHLNHDDVVSQLRDIGLELDLPLQIAVGEKSVRCRIANGDREKRGWYRLHEFMADDGLYLVGSYGIFYGADAGTQIVTLSRRCESCGASVPFKEKKCPACGSGKLRSKGMTEEQKTAIRERMAADKKRAEADRQHLADRAASWARAVWKACTPIQSISEHDYLARKGMTSAHGAKLFNGNDGIHLEGADKDDYSYLAAFAGALVIPIMDTTGRIHGLQFILSREKHADRIRRTGRDKDFWPAGMAMEGHFYQIGPSPAGYMIITEGFATGGTIKQENGATVFVAFNAGNLGPVAKNLRKQYKRINQLIAADDDWLQKCKECGIYTTVDQPICTGCGKPHGKINAGKQRAAEAALANGGEWLAPVFENRPADRKGPTDFNDLADKGNQAAARLQIEAKLSALGWSLPRARELSPEGGGVLMQKAVSVMELGDAIARFIPIDDDQGETLFDNWTYSLVHKKKMIGLLQAGVRFDDVKRDPVWIERGAYYLHQVGFDPAGTDGHIRLNTWRGWPSEPKAGKCDRLLDLLRFLCSAEQNSREVFEWILCRTAFSIQFPGKKLPSAIIMHGPQGTGKSTFFKALARIFGDQHPTKNYSVILDQKALQDNFNADWENKLFVLAEEVVNSSDKWQLKNELKELVSGETLRIRKVYRDGYPQKNLLFMVFLSNEKQPLPLDNDDRRHLVVWTPEPASYAFYDEVREEIENGGIEALHQFFVDYDLSKFRPTDRPPMTESKTRLIGLSLPSEVRFVKEYLCGDTEWPVVPSLSADFYAAYVIWCRRNGEKHPRASHQFWGEIERLPGWKKYKQRVFNDLHCIGATTPKNVVIPPAAALQASGTAKPDAEQMDRWVTHGYIEFRNAGKDAEESKWAA